MAMRPLLRVALLALAWTAVIAMPAVAQPAAPQATGVTARQPSPASDPYTVVVTDEMRAHQRWVDRLYFADAVYGFLVLLALLGFGVSRRLRDLAGRVTRRPFLAAMLFIALFAVAITVLSLPLAYFAHFVIPHRFKLSQQSLGGWTWDLVKAMLLQIALGAPIGALALVGIRRVRRWWLAIWIGSIPIALFLVVISPVLLSPVFNRFEPLRDEKLRTELLDLASRAGISGARVFQVDKSKQTSTMNAYVNGLGPTKRIVLWDTIIAKMDHDELRFVMAHEMGHYVLHHMWEGLAFILAVLLVVLWLAQQVAEAATWRWGPSWGFSVLHDPAAVPLLLLVISVFFFLLTPLLNGFSRGLEHQADVFSLEVTHLNDPGARAFVKMAEDSKVLPDPDPFIRFWRYDHPTLAERIAFCRSYRPWEEGKPNRVWRRPGA